MGADVRVAPRGVGGKRVERREEMINCLNFLMIAITIFLTLFKFFEVNHFRAKIKAYIFFST
jgi:hypothetical protein